jgi:hypothetical protein
MSDFLYLLPKLQELLAAGMSLAEDIVEDDGSVNVDIVVSLLRKRSSDWHPAWKDVPIFDQADPGTREAGVRFLAGLAIRAVGKKVTSRMQTARSV